MMPTKMSKQMKIMLISVGILFGCIFIFQGFKSFMISRALSSNKNIVTPVSAMKLEYQLWQPQLKASGSLRAVRGVNVTTELAALVKTINFTPGAYVKEGELLVQLNADSDIAQLHALEANAELAKTIYVRDKAQYAVKAISKVTLDTDAANLKNLQAQVAQQAAIVAKKTIRAPFEGRLGICLINPGQYINTGDKIVNLQSLDPIYADFYVPQQELTRLKVGQTVNITSNMHPDRAFTGTITTIDPGIDPATRNVQVEATIANPTHELTPGMFASVQVDIGEPQRYLTLPQTAITFNPYGNIAFIIRESGKDKKGKPILKATQTFVTTGETRGDQITVLTGLKEGDLIVTSGQLKLKNGSAVVINNAIVPANNPTPQVKNEH